MMGRWRDGTPLVLSPDRPDPRLASSNDFGYATQDPDGHRCPFSAHIRIVNPRDTPLDPAAVEGVPRVLRRGMAYGPPLQGVPMTAWTVDLSASSCAQTCASRSTH